MNTRDQPVILIMTWLPHHFVLLFYPCCIHLVLLSWWLWEREREKVCIFTMKMSFCIIWPVVVENGDGGKCFYSLPFYTHSKRDGITVLAWLLAWFLSSSLLMCISCAWIPLIWRNRHRYRVRQTSKVPIKASHRTTITKPLQLHDDHDHLDLFYRWCYCLFTTFLAWSLNLPWCPLLSFFLRNALPHYYCYYYYCFTHTLPHECIIARSLL